MLTRRLKLRCAIFFRNSMSVGRELDKHASVPSYQPHRAVGYIRFPDAFACVEPFTRTFFDFMVSQTETSSEGVESIILQHLVGIFTTPNLPLRIVSSERCSVVWLWLASLSNCNIRQVHPGEGFVESLSKGSFLGCA